METQRPVCQERKGKDSEVLPRCPYLSFLGIGKDGEESLCFRLGRKGKDSEEKKVRTAR